MTAFASWASFAALSGFATWASFAPLAGFAAWAAFTATEAACGEFERLAFEFFELGLLFVGQQRQQGCVAFGAEGFHAFAHFAAATGTFAAAGPALTAAVTHGGLDRFANLLLMSFSGALERFGNLFAEAQFAGDLGGQQGLDTLLLQRDLLQSLQLFGQQQFVQLFIDRFGSFGRLRSHAGGEFRTLLFRSVAEVEIGSFGARQSFANFLQSVDLVVRHLQFLADFVAAEQAQQVARAAAKAAAKSTTKAAWSAALASGLGLGIAAVAERQGSGYRQQGKFFQFHRYYSAGTGNGRSRLV